MIPKKEQSTFSHELYGCEADEVEETVILTPIDEIFQSLKKRADSTKEFNGFFRCFNASFGSRSVSVINSRIGSPLASDCTYFLRFTPCRRVLFTGLIGALQEQIRIGDLIIPTGAFRGEGASQYFVEKAYPAVADFRFLDELRSALDEAYRGLGINMFYGPIYTTDSFASETEEFLNFWQSKRLLGIEMETSVVYVIASLYGISAAAVHVVSDNPVVDRTFFHPIPEEDRARRRLSTGLLIDALINLIKKG